MNKIFSKFARKYESAILIETLLKRGNTSRKSANQSNRKNINLK